MRLMPAGAGALALLLLLLTGCVSSEFAAVKTEPGYYYGFGSGKTEADAQTAGLDDLVYNTFTETGSIPKERKARVTLTPEMKAAVSPLAPKPYIAEKKSETSFTAVYRIKYTDWTKAETVRLAALRTDLGAKFSAVTSDTKSTLGARLVAAVRVAQAVEKNGATLSLKVDDAGPLLNDAIVAWAKAQLGGTAVAFSPASGLVDAGSPVVLTFTAGGKPLTGIAVSAVWTLDSGATAPLTLTTDAKGAASAAYPADQAFRNAKPTLKVTTKLASLVAEPSFLASLDTAFKAEAGYRNSVVLANLKTPEVRIAGGTFAIGAVKQDRRAGGKEKARNATVKSFFIDTTPVTNAQFRAYLEAVDVPKAEWPDFLSDETLSGDDQPVVGVTYGEAQKYAAWASSVLGVTKRLPTEEEYEVAARAGGATIYPWGDQLPTDGVRANYTGNKKFSTTSPVGSFPNGANALGVLDMVGNVWEWTSSAPDALITADPSFKIVKGGSWLDGPSELRVSNRKAADPNETASDLGFRLVREE